MFDLDSAGKLLAPLLTLENVVIWAGLIMVGYMLKAIERIPNAVIPAILLILGPWAKVAISGTPIAYNLVLGLFITGLAHLSHGAIIKQIENRFRCRGEGKSTREYKPPVKLSLLAVLLVPCFLLQGCNWFGTAASESSASTDGATSTTSKAVINTATYYTAMVAGGVSANLVINNADKDNKLGTAQCVVAVSAPLYAACTGKEISVAQMQAIVDAFKIKENTTTFQPVIAKGVADFVAYVNGQLVAAGLDEATIKNIETGYVYGWQYMGQVSVTKYSAR